MTQTRRTFLNVLLAQLLVWRWGQAWPKTASRKAAEGENLAQAMNRELAGRHPVEGGKLTLEAPEIAENGAIVPITVESGLPDVDTIWIFVEKNPTPLAARFRLDNSLDTFVSLRIKMNESCDVIAVIKSGEEYFSARKKVRVVVGGCG